MDYFEIEHNENKKNNRKFIFPIVFFILSFIFIVIFFIIKDDLFHEDYYGPGMETSEIETVTTEDKKNRNNNNYDLNNETLEEINEYIETIPYDNNTDVVATSSSIDDLDIFNENISTVSDIYNNNIDKLAFVGDIYFSQRNLNTYDNGDIFRMVNKKYIDIINEHNSLISNLEICFTNENNATTNKEFTFKASPSYVNILKDLNMDLVTVANNHTLDFGEKGFLDTLETLRNANIGYVGGGRNEEEAKRAYVLNINGRRYGIIAATSVVPSVKWFAEGDKCGLNSGYSSSPICNQIRALKKAVDKVIVYMHWGVEKDEISNEAQQTMARKFVDFGADLVVGAHSHRLQEVEYYNHTPIVYGIGNFIFGSTSTDTEVLSVTFDYTNKKSGDIKIKLIPGTCGFELTSPLPTENKIKEYLINTILPKSPTCLLDEEGYLVENVFVTE